MVVTDEAGGVKVVVTPLTSTTYFASTGGGHITIAWNVDPATAASNIMPTSPTFTAHTSLSPPGCSAGCGTFTDGLQGDWSGTSNSFAGPVTFFLSGLTTADFMNNSAGFMAAVDILGPGTTGEVAGTGSVVSTPEPSTWAMMLVGFAGLAYAGFRKTKKARALSLA